MYLAMRLQWPASRSHNHALARANQTRAASDQPLLRSRPNKTRPGPLPAFLGSACRGAYHLSFVVNEVPLADHREAFGLQRLLGHFKIIDHQGDSGAAMR